MNPGIVIVNQQKVIEAISQFPILPQYKNFSLVATSEGQTQFTLNDYPVLTGILSVNLNGIAQDPLNGDYTIVNNILTMSPGVSLGDKVAGFYQVMAPVVGANVLNFASYYELVADADKTIFTLSFQPNPIVYVAVNGIVQDIHDYTISGYTLTLNSGLDIDDKLYVVGINN